MAVVPIHPEPPRQKPHVVYTQQHMLWSRHPHEARIWFADLGGYRFCCNCWWSGEWFLPDTPTALAADLAIMAHYRDTGTPPPRFGFEYESSILRVPI